MLKMHKIPKCTKYKVHTIPNKANLPNEEEEKITKCTTKVKCSLAQKGLGPSWLIFFSADVNLQVSYKV